MPEHASTPLEVQPDGDCFYVQEVNAASGDELATVWVGPKTEAEAEKLAQMFAAAPAMLELLEEFSIAKSLEEVLPLMTQSRELLSHIKGEWAQQDSG